MNYKNLLLIIFLIFTVFLTSCKLSLNYKEVEILIEKIHPFEYSSGENLWYTLSYTNGAGDIKYCHINQNQKSIKLWVKKNVTIFITARVLNDFSPIGGVIMPGEDNRVILNYKNGYLVSFLQDLYLQNPRATSSLNYEKLYNILNKRGLLFSFDKLILARDLLNGELSETSIFELDNLEINLYQAIEGYWISENPDEGGFVISDSNYKRVSLSLGEGNHYYINFEKGYKMLIIVDTRSKKYFVRIEEVNPEFK